MGGTGDFLTKQWKAYKQQTLEVLNTLSVRIDEVDWESAKNDRSKISFQLENVRREMSVAKFGEVYGFKNKGEKSIMKGFKTVSIHTLWRKMIGIERFSKLAKRIEHELQ
ncbi:hypothetical protein Droror1_Dr00008613 [Drosera rotundifolia]